MFIYSESNKKKFLVNEKLEKLAKETLIEEEMFELIKIENPFINREIAKNVNITVEVMNCLLQDKYSAYTMNTHIAKNPKLTKEIKEKLYLIADNQYKESTMREELDLIFSKMEK